jgi:diguanylate cyclase (GGDEF)-like protein/PAS domain S-box-containing protein
MDLRILFIDDSEDDVILLLRDLQKGGYDVQSARVQTAGDMQAALASQPWDLILCDYSIPSMNATQALEILQNSGLDLPLIIVSGTIEEEAAVFALKAGAHDFLLKSNLARLLPAIGRELKEAETRRQHKRVSDSLHASELRFRSTLESMMEGCQIIGYDWRYLYLNDSAVKDSQQTRESLLGRTIMECNPGIENSAMFTTLQHCMDERTSNYMVNEFIFPNGSKGWFELSIQPAPDGIFILSSDITKRKQAEQGLLEREMKLAILLDILPVGISILDAERKISYTNPALKKMLDISEEGLIEGVYRNRKYLRADGSLMPVDEWPSNRAFKEKIEIDGVEAGVVKEDDSIVWTDVSAVPVNVPDWKVVMVTSDITERKQAEREILKLNAELEAKVAERTAELAAANERLHQLSIFDELTGLYNRRGFLLLAEEQLSLARRARHNNLLIFYADLDGLKQINDHFGHSAGDEAIITAARALDKTFRTSDIKARLGGDEFIVLAVEADENIAQTLLVRLREGLAENNQSLSVGIVTFDAQKDNSIHDLITRADEAMYTEKRTKSGHHNL